MRTLNWLLQVLLCVCLVITLVSTAIVIYIDEAYLGLIKVVCEDDFNANSEIEPAFNSVEACVDYIKTFVCVTGFIVSFILVSMQAATVIVMKKFRDMADDDGHQQMKPYDYRELFTSENECGGDASGDDEQLSFL